MRAELIATLRKSSDVYLAAGNDLIDDVIDPRETRETICRALEMAQGKQIERPWKRRWCPYESRGSGVITCSISGAIANREQCPAIPYTPAEYAAEARRIVDEGGVMIHIHARTPEGIPSYEVEDFQAITEAIRAEVGDAVIVNYSTGTIGVPVEKRVAYLRACRPEVAALNMGSMNYAKYSRSRKQFVFAMVFQNPFEEIIALLEAMNELGIKPEHECFDVGHIGSLEPLIDMGVLHTPLHVDCVMGVTGGIPPSARNLEAMVDNLPAGSHWGVIGISASSGCSSPVRSPWAARSGSGSRTTSTCRTAGWRSPTAS